MLQAAERVVFGVDEASGTVEMHVQVSYTGEAEDFAWIVPVPADPELSVSTSDLFTQVALATLPTFRLVVQDAGCRVRAQDEVFSDSAVPSDSIADASGGYDVTVVDRAVVGPYDAVTLHAASADDLLGWLDTSGYQIPAELDAVLQPYVSADASFVALKLAPGRDVGDLAPLLLRYRADRATIPIRLTSVAATPDMRVEAYVFGRGRGVPESYLHVGINELAVDWWSGGGNYSAVVTQAANEAGGHAFATDYYGDSDIVPVLFRGVVPEEALRAAPTGAAWVEVLRGTGIRPTPEVLAVIEDALDLPPGQGANAWACPDCVEPAGFAAGLATDMALERVFAPLEAAQALIDGYPRLARMSSSLDAVEMTVDPVFVVNHDLDDALVGNQWTATLVYECDGGARRERADRHLLLARSGLSVRLPSEDALAEMGMSEFEYLASLRDYSAVTIEQLGAEGRARPSSTCARTSRRGSRRSTSCWGGPAGATAAGHVPWGAGIAAAFAVWARRRRARR
ncbi:MAG: DUF2330 domain-containing protein [Myxococcota bacterium]